MKCLALFYHFNVKTIIMQIDWTTRFLSIIYRPPLAWIEKITNCRLLNYFGTITFFMPASHKRDIGKQCRPRSLVGVYTVCINTGIFIECGYNKTK